MGAAGAIGVVIGLHGVAELSPLPFAESAFIFGYAAICSLGPNDLIKFFLWARILRAPRPEKIEPGKNEGHPTLVTHPFLSTPKQRLDSLSSSITHEP